MSRKESRVLLASAGTGKTHQMTNRLLRLYASGVDPRRVLASTFARKAAGEILERLLGRVADAASSEAKAAELSRHVGQGLDSDAARSLAARLLRDIDKLRISTLDAWFKERVQARSLELGLPPDWDVSDPALERRLAGRALSRALERPRTNVEWSTLIADLKRGGAESRVHASLLTSLSSAGRFARECTKTAWEFPPLPPELDEQDGERALAALARAELPTTKAGKPNAHYVKALPKLLEAARGRDWEGFVKSTLARRVVEGASEFGTCEIPEPIRVAVSVLAARAARDAALAVRAQNRALSSLARDFLEELDAAALDERRLPFDALPRLLAAHAAGESDGADRGVDHLLLDEFQDTSSLQWRALEPCVQSVLDRDGASLFCVGDVKQSIYGWREGNPRLLAELPRRLDVPQESIARSYRSSQVVLDFVQFVFETLDVNPVLGGGPEAAGAAGSALRDAAQRFLAVYERQSSAFDLPGRVRLSWGPQVDDARLIKPREDARLLRGVAAAVELLRAHPDWSLAFLVRAKKLVPALLERLKAAGISASGEGGNPLTDSGAVHAALSLLEFADHPDDGFVAFHLASSPFAAFAGVGLGDSRERRHAASAALRRRVRSVGPASLIAELEPVVHEHYGAFDQRRFAQLLALAQRLEPSEPLRPARFAERLALERVPDLASSRVQVLTIHGAKGLEFDAVILLDLDTALAGKSSPVVAHRTDGDPREPFDVVTHTLSKEAVILVPELARVQDAALSARVFEELCILYVALTRAVHHVEMWVDYPGLNLSKSSFAGLLLQAIQPTEPPPPDSVVYDTEPGVPLSGGPPELPIQGPDAAVAIARIELAPGARPPARVAPSRSGATAERRARATVELFAEAAGDGVGREARGRGLLWHAWCEAFAWDERGAPSAADLVALARDGGHGAVDAREAERFLAGLRAPEVARLFSRADMARRLDASEGELALGRERAFAFLREGPGGSELVQGAIDRAVVARAAGRALVVDFKSDAVEAGDCAARAEAYRPQLELYREALARLEGLAPERIGLCVCFLAAGRAVELP